MQLLQQRLRDIERSQRELQQRLLVLQLREPPQTEPSWQVPPPPASQYFPLGSQVFAARAMASFSNGSFGFPGTVYQRHFCAPVFAS